MKKTYSKNFRQGLPGGPNEMFEKVKGIIVSQRGQWDFPGMNTMVPTDDGRITMRGVPYPVYGQDETGYGQMMYPNQEYQFPGKNVLELPMAQRGGDLKKFQIGGDELVDDVSEYSDDNNLYGSYQLPEADIIDLELPIYKTPRGFYERNKDLQTYFSEKDLNKGIYYHSDQYNVDYRPEIGNNPLLIPGVFSQEDLNDDKNNSWYNDNYNAPEFPYCSDEGCTARANRVVSSLFTSGSPYFQDPDKTKEYFGATFSADRPPTEAEIKKYPYAEGDTEVVSLDAWDQVDAAMRTMPGNVLYSNIYIPKNGEITQANIDAVAKKTITAGEIWKKYKIPIGSIINVGQRADIPTYVTDRKIVAGTHTVRVVGYTDTGEPLVADYGEVKPLSQNIYGSNAYVAGVITIPGNEKFTYDHFVEKSKLKNKPVENSDYYVKDIIDSKNVESNPLNVFSNKKYSEEFVNFNKSIINEENKLRSKLNISKEKYDQYAKIALTIAGAETEFGKGLFYNLLDFGDSTGITQLNKKNIEGKYEKTLSAYTKGTTEYDAVASILYIKELDKYKKEWSQKGSKAQERPFGMKEGYSLEAKAKNLVRELQGKDSYGYNQSGGKLNPDTFTDEKGVVKLPFKQPWQSEEDFTKEVNETLRESGREDLRFAFKNGKRTIFRKTLGNKIPDTLEDIIFYSWQSPSSYIYGDAQGDSNYYKKAKRIYGELFSTPKKQLGGALPKAQVGDEIFPGEGQYYNIPEYTYNYKRGFDDLPTPRYTGPLMNQRLIDEATQREYEQRKRAIEESVAAAREPLSTQRLARESAATGDKFSLQMNLGDPYNNPRLYETLGALDFINPGVMLGDMVTGLGSIPYNVQEGNYGAAAVGLGLPLATGALASIGVKSPRQFINNLVNPVAGIGDTPKQLPGSSNVAPVINAARNLEDLKAAQQFAQKYGYELPANLERVAQSNEFTDRVIRGMMNRHNNFVRGVSTNWEELGKRNPEILRHLEGKGFDLSTKEGTKAAAEYMATHIPINTGYGRASLDADVFNRGMQGLYTSNSIPTAEGYTYGQGYIVSGKKPTNYSSSNRQDWINQNNTYYKDEDQFRKLMYPLSEESKDIVGLAKVPAYEKNKMEVINSVKSKMDSVQKEIEQLKKGNVKYTGESIEESITIRNKIIEDLNKDIKYLEQHGDELLKKPGEYKILRTERSDLPTDPFAFLIQKEGNAKKMSEWLKTQPYQQKMREMNDLGESLSNYTWEQQKLIRDKIDILKKEANEMYNKSVQDYMKINHPDYDPVNKYAHYIHLGVPGEKVLQPIKSWEITPEIWKNKSRRHSNKYSKKFSAMANGGILNMQRFGGNLNFQKGGDYNMKRASELGYTPDEAGHYPSVDEETGMWLKSKQHPTAWMESMYGYQLNPEVYNNYNVTYNPEGYFGENQLQYMSKQFGGSLPTAGDPVLNFIQRQSPRFYKSKK